MPSFDFVSEVDMHEVTNAVDQASREVNTRFDFKGTGSRFDRDDKVIAMVSQSEFQLGQMLDILREKLNRRNIDVRCLTLGEVTTVGQEARQSVTVRQGIDADLCRRIVKEVKGAKLKVQAAVQGEQVRITGKKRDDLQTVIALVREMKLDLPIQQVNFRD